MPVEIHWYLRNRVIFVRLRGTVNFPDLEDI
jgi:hypothetical protein